ncbi:MAG: membrane protein insertase YidC [Candidatus Eremiobacteraeota bacterium]|nr:membrane protein insertase YidC [Candidatus Eremiobacteraeota bacterium]
MQWIANIFISVLESLNSLTGNFGLSLVLFAGIIKIALWPLTTMQYKSMKVMQDAKPEMDKIQAKYKGDTQAMNKAMQEFYMEKGINPLSGCLPLIVQMPILFSIWRAIIGSPELFSNAYFLWIRPGPIQLNYSQYFASSLADRDALLILMYGVTMVIQQQLTPSTGQGNQKQIGLFMSIFFTGLMWVYSWPCALIVYWVVFNFLNIIQQGIIHRTTAGDPKDAKDDSKEKSDK